MGLPIPGRKDVPILWLDQQKWRGTADQQMEQNAGVVILPRVLEANRYGATVQGTATAQPEVRLSDVAAVVEMVVAEQADMGRHEVTGMQN